MKKTNVTQLVYCALFAALIVVFAQLSIHIGPVPISLATFGVMMAGLLLGWKYGAVSVLVYILLGAVGVPVFAGFKGGVSALVGATGGYIVGYLPYAIISGLPLPTLQKDAVGRFLLMEIGTVACYVLGTLWFMHVTGRTWYDSLGICVTPFLPGDAAKMVLATLLAPRLRKALSASLHQ